MKLNGKKKAGKSSGAKVSSINNPNANSSKKFFWMLVIVVVAGAAIFYVNNLGRKAQETISVAMFTRPIHKNEVITLDCMAEYKMLIGEYEKYSIVQENGNIYRRVILWEEAPKAVGLFAAYPLQQNTVAMYRDFIKSRVDNTDNVMYTFPGKDIVSLEIKGAEIDAFKTFIQPGDRLNIEAMYMETIREKRVNDYGQEEIVSVDVFKPETLFKDIMIADILNASGVSVLDIYSSYNQLTVWQQAQYEADPNFQKSTTPSKLLVALSPEELNRYFYFLAKNDISFKVTLPQRVE